MPVFEKFLSRDLLHFKFNSKLSSVHLLSKGAAILFSRPVLVFAVVLMSYKCDEIVNVYGTFTGSMHTQTVATQQNMRKVEKENKRKEQTE